MPRQLTITPTPFKSSNLALPPSPFSPKLPLTPLLPRPPRLSPHPSAAPSIFSPPPPPTPLPWLWQCHLCNRVYPLGVTRRCLDDGHYFCAGTTTAKRSRRSGKKVLRHKACASEFDYQGWKGWGVWRKEARERVRVGAGLLREAETGGRGDAAEGESDSDASLSSLGTGAVVPVEGEWFGGRGGMRTVEPLRLGGKDCWGRCDYPSECRWGKQYGVATPVQPTAGAAVTPPPPPPPTASEARRETLVELLPADAGTPKTTFDDILLDASVVEASTAEQLERQGRPVEQTTGVPEAPGENTKKPSMDDLLESVQRRKRRSLGAAPSPLASHPPSPTSPGGSLASGEVVAAGMTEGWGVGGEDVVGANALQKALDDFELDVRKSLERAGELVAGWGNSMKAAKGMEEERADALVKGLRISKKRG